jgi:AraC-like DNA-binding protein
VKELLKYGELTLSEIAFKMGYSSVQHLSNQFKRITGLTPSHFKDLKETLRKPLDKVGPI